MDDHGPVHDRLGADAQRDGEGLGAVELTDAGEGRVVVPVQEQTAAAVGRFEVFSACAEPAAVEGGS